MPNSFAYLVLFSWPLVVVLLFWKLSVPRALVISILGGYLFLPEQTGIDLPILPMLDKTLIPSLAAGIMCLVMSRRRAARPGMTGWPVPPGPAPAAPGTPLRTNRGRLLFRLLFVLLFLTPVLTVLQNSDPIFVGPLVLPGLRPYDMGAIIMGLGVTFLPFLLAQRFLARPEDQVMLLRAFVIAALVYSLLGLYEVRMSPQLNNMIYGFFPSSFLQHIRAGGFRPIVFLPHGLWVGIFLAMSIVAATTMALWSRRHGGGGLSAFGWFATVLWLLLALFLTKAVGALSLTLIFVPLLILVGVQGQLLCAMIVAGVTLFYPLLRGAGWIPIDTVYEVALSFSQERAESLKYRLDNEDDLLERAAEKPLAGWGSWGRNQIYDPWSGRQTSVTDGAWIIMIGVFGWVGYIAHFGLLTAPLFLLGISRRKLGLSLESSGLAMVLAINLIDLIPNGTLTPLTYLVAGALAGRYAMAAAPVAGKAAAPSPPKPERTAWPQPPGLAARMPRGRAAAPDPASAPVRAADSRKYRQPRQRPE
ncbi:MAG: hypothetical protein V4516_09360 [Pseudomonadota bacterium]